jgi:hypothetical protein
MQVPLGPAEAQVQFLIATSEFRGGIGAVFSLSSSVFPADQHYTIAPQSSVTATKKYVTALTKPPLALN